MTEPEKRDALRVTVYDRSKPERVLRAVREVAAIVALVLASILMALLLFTLGSIVNRLGADDPGELYPTPVTGCEPGDVLCD
jgi:hypothetical protein